MYKATNLLLHMTSEWHACLSEPAVLRGASLPPTVVYVGTASLIVLLPGQGNLAAVLLW